MGRRFRITVTGRLGSEFLAAFDEVRLKHRGPDTVVSGEAFDQAHLDGIVSHLRDLGLEVTDLRSAPTVRHRFDVDHHPPRRSRDEEQTMNTLRWAYGLILMIHGLGHLLGVIALTSIGSDSWNTRSWLLTDPIGDGPARIISTVLWVSATVLFLTAGLAIFDVGVSYTSWRTLAVAGATVSLTAMAMFWNAFPVLFPNKIGSIGIDLAVLIGILVIDWPTDTALDV